MFRRNLTVVFKPSKNNALQLPASYFNAVQEYVSIVASRVWRYYAYVT